MVWKMKEDVLQSFMGKLEACTSWLMYNMRDCDHVALCKKLYLSRLWITPLTVHVEVVMDYFWNHWTSWCRKQTCSCKYTCCCLCSPLPASEYPAAAGGSLNFTLHFLLTFRLSESTLKIHDICQDVEPLCTAATDRQTCHCVLPICKRSLSSITEP